MSVTFYVPEADFEKACLNVSNRNAGWLLGQLFPDEPYRYEASGQIDPDWLLTAIGNADIPDDGVEDDVTTGQNGGVFVDCGVRPGYFREKLEQLAYIAAVAKARGEYVVFS